MLFSGNLPLVCGTVHKTLIKQKLCIHIFLHFNHKYRCGRRERWNDSVIVHAVLSVYPYHYHNQHLSS